MQLAGIIENIIYSKEGFSIANLSEDDSNKHHTILGNMNVVIGEHLKLNGHFEKSDYGIRFKVKEYKRNVPNTREGVAALLGSGLLKGIGPSRADWMVNYFGTDVVDIIKNQDSKILEVPGIGKKLADTIYEQWHQFYGKERIVSLLASSGFSRSMIRKIIVEFNDDKLTKIEDNPFELMTVPGVGFRRADYFAKLLGISDTHPKRIEESIIYLLEENGKGNTYLPKDYLFTEFKDKIRFSEEAVHTDLFDKALRTLSRSAHKNNRITVDDKGVHLLKFAMAETTIAKDLMERSLVSATDIGAKELLEQINAWEKKQDFNLTKDQHSAIIRSILDNVTVVTGSPGTGKTSTLAALLHVCEYLDYNIMLAAPTGRAAKRMQEATGMEASTIHRMLGFGKEGDFRFTYNRDNKLDVDMVIIDEVSMIDVMLMQALLGALKKKTTLVLVGDKDQLQSVSAGNVLDDIIRSGKINTIQLREIFRQDSNALLVKNAMLVNSGRVSGNTNPLIGGNEWGSSDFYITSNVTNKNVMSIITKHIPEKYKIDMEDILLITPMRKKIGTLNCSTLNEEMQQTFNPTGEKIPIKDCLFRVGDKVMQMKNDYIKNIFNGDIGRIIDFEASGRMSPGYIHVDFYGDIVEYEFTEWKSLVHAWASTIHKAQGSESDAVICILPDNFIARRMLTRNLLYTGITRAKRVCVLVAKDKEIIKAIRTSGTETRYTDLTDKLEIWYRRLNKLI
jgi:exodeoxyribonuclease V alpha subunit